VEVAFTKWVGSFLLRNPDKKSIIRD